MASPVSQESIYRTLESEIAELKLYPGEILSENTLCKRFGVSRTPIRSVLQKLEQNRFVKIIPCKGTIVTPIDLHIANQLIYRRVAIETMVLRDFALAASPQEIEEVRYRLDLLRQAAAEIDSGGEININAFLSKDLAMHELWFKSTDNMYLWEDLKKPQADYSRFIRLDIIGARNVPDVLIEHTEMMRIIDEKDVSAIEPLMRRHLYGGVRRLGSKVFSEEYRACFEPDSL